MATERFQDLAPLSRDAFKSISTTDDKRAIQHKRLGMGTELSPVLGLQLYFYEQNSVDDAPTVFSVYLNREASKTLALQALRHLHLVAPAHAAGVIATFETEVRT